MTTGPGYRRNEWPPSRTDLDGNRYEHMCQRPTCDLVDRFWTFAKLCRCGNPETLAALILAGLNAHSESGPDFEPPDLDWIDRNLPLAYMLDAWGLTEHGVGIYGAWLTPDGWALRRALSLVDLNTVLDADHACA